MITGSFTTSLGDVTVSINAGSGTCKIVSIGTINYNFDITPDQVTIDRVQALYQTINISLFQYNDVGVDLYETITAQAILGNVRVDLSIFTHDLETFEFPFMVGVNDVTINEQTREVMLKCQQFIDNTVTNADVFTELTTDGDTYSFIKLDTDKVPNSYTCAVPEKFVTKAMREFFGNNYDTVYESGSSGLGDGYSDRIFDGDPASTGYTEQFVLVNMVANQFVSLDEKAPIITAGSGKITFLSFVNRTTRTNNREFNDAEPIVTGDVNTLFVQEVSVGDRIYATINQLSVFVGVAKVVTGSAITLEAWPMASLPDGVFANFQIHKFRTPELVSSIDTVKDLAGAEGAIFGTGFSQNFYINRLREKNNIQIPFQNITDLKSSPFYFSLGTSVVRQSASYQRNGAKELGRYESRRQAGSANIGVYSRNMPNLIDTSSVARPFAGAVKELKIEFAPAYPILNKARYGKPQNAPTSFFDGDYAGFESDKFLEQSLTSLGLRSYIRALNNKGDDIVVEFTCTGAFRLKPYETFTFSTDSPESVVGRKFRPTELHYDIVNDTLRCKAYQVDVTADEVQSSDGAPTLLGVIANELDYGQQPSLGGTVIKNMRVNAQSLINPVVITSSNPNFIISRTGESFSQTIELSPDGQGNVQQEVFVAFAPKSSGSFESTIEFSTFITPTTAVTRSFTVFGSAYSGFTAGDWGVVLQVCDGEFTSIFVNLFSACKAGSEIEIINPLTNTVFVVTVTADTPAGVQNLPIEAQVLDIPINSYIRGSSAYQGTGIFVSENQIVLKVNSNGDIAQIALGVDGAIGSVIDISADQVKINGIIFTEGTDPSTDPGDIKTLNYVSGIAGWKIEGNGNAEFNDVTVRGSLETSTIEGDLTMDGGAIKNTANTYVIDEDGIEYTVDASNDLNPVNARNVGFRFSSNELAYVQGAYDTVSGRMTLVLGADSAVESIVEFVADSVFIKNLLIDSSSIRAGIPFQAEAITDSTSKDTGSIITEGGIGIEKSAYIGGSLNAPKVTITPITDSNSPYTVLATDTHIAVDNGANAVTINLPTGTLGRKITIFDTAGTASLGTITINRASTNTINGATSTTLTTNHQSVTLLFNAGNWTII